MDAMFNKNAKVVPYTVVAANMKTMFTSNKSDSISKQVLFTVLLIIIACSILSSSLTIGVYFITIVVKLIRATPSEGILNIESDEYKIIQSLNFKNNQSAYKYTIVFVIYVIAFICIIIFIIMFYGKITKAENIDLLKFIVIMFAISIVMIVISITLYYTVGKQLFRVNDKLKTFNRYVNAHIYKKLNFLKLVENPPMSIIESNTVIQNCLRIAYNSNASKTDLAKAFYTLTLFHHYQKLSSRNPLIYDAFKLFKATYQITNDYLPSAYLQRYGTYIEDIGSTLILPNLDHNIKNVHLDSAILLCNNWVSRTNELANTFYPEDAMTSFLIITIVLFITNLFCAFIFGGLYSLITLTGSLKVFINGLKFILNKMLFGGLL